jgi:hypothetical protein
MTTKADEQRERAQVLANDASLRNSGTYFSHTHSDAGGRFATVGAVTVVGQTPNPYPALPDSSPWHGADPVPNEPPLGYRIDEYSLAQDQGPASEASGHVPDAGPPNAPGLVAPSPGPATDALTSVRADEVGASFSRRRL